MTSEAFEEWMEKMGLSTSSEVAEFLGVHRNTVDRWRRRGTGETPFIDLACMALYHKMEPWK